MARIVFSYSNAAIKLGEEDGDLEVHTTSGILDARTEKVAKERAMDLCLMNYPVDQGFIGQNAAVHGPFTIIV